MADESASLELAREYAAEIAARLGRQLMLLAEIKRDVPEHAAAWERVVQRTQDELSASKQLLQVLEDHVQHRGEQDSVTDGLPVN